MRTNGTILSKNETVMFPTKNLVASCKPKNSVAIAGIKPNKMKRWLLALNLAKSRYGYSKWWYITGIMKRTADTVIENRAIKRMILSMRTKPAAELIEMFSKNPNRKTEKVVRIALSRNTAP